MNQTKKIDDAALENVHAGAEWSTAIVVDPPPPSDPPGGGGPGSGQGELLPDDGKSKGIDG